MEKNRKKAEPYPFNLAKETVWENESEMKLYRTLIEEILAQTDPPTEEKWFDGKANKYYDRSPHGVYLLVAMHTLDDGWDSDDTNSGKKRKKIVSESYKKRQKSNGCKNNDAKTIYYLNKLITPEGSFGLLRATMDGNEIYQKSQVFMETWSSRLVDVTATLERRTLFAKDQVTLHHGGRIPTESWKGAGDTLRAYYIKRTPTDEPPSIPLYFSNISYI
jgi:hypothetical protein